MRHRPLLKSKNTGRFRQEYTGSHWNVEAVFRSVPDEKRSKVTRMRRGKTRKFRARILFPLAEISRVFLADPVLFPPFSYRLLLDPVIGIFDLGSFSIVVPGFILCLTISYLAKLL